MRIKFYRLILTLLTLYSSIAVSQENKRKILKGIVENEITENTMNGVHVLNLSTIVGTTSDEKGVFEIEAKAKDTLYFSYLGFKPFKVAVTADMLKFENPKFKLTVLAFALEEVVLRPYQLTGYLDIDVKNVPLNPAGRYNIQGLPSGGYEAGNRNRSSIAKAVGALFNPADFLYNLFGKNPAQMRKLKKMRADDEIKSLLASKFDREVLIQLLGINRVNIEEILRNCNYSKAFILEANDLQILEAISGCYEEFKVLQL
ncbi:MAG: carboxypeptidase-like regulatory domain-containing protein [Flavobacteriaceae bacterium]|nr:carboxypeptidase-like regulatory domain-containing protein [Flavobacteriaceae bacterium]